jgi:hypothetical protein
MLRTIPAAVLLSCCLLLRPGLLLPMTLAAGYGAATTATPNRASTGRSLTRQQMVLRDRIRRVLSDYYAKQLNTRDDSPWSIMHATLAFGVDTQIRRGGPRGAPVTSVGWLCYNRAARGQRLFFSSGTGFAVRGGPGVQGHNGQLVAILAQSRVMSDYAIQVDGQDFTIADLVDYEKQHCVPKTELTFRLIGLAHYLDSDAAWQVTNGQQWSIPRLIREEMALPIRGATCGGTHRLMGLSYAVHMRAKRGEPIDGDYRRALLYTQKYQRYAFKLQNRDGSFSTEWFRGRGDRPDTDRKLTTSGHIFEWLVFSLPQRDLANPKMVRGAYLLTNLLLREPDRDWQIGALGHALHALVLYDKRRFGGTVADYQQRVASRRRASVGG